MIVSQSYCTLQSNLSFGATKPKPNEPRSLASEISPGLGPRLRRRGSDEEAGCTERRQPAISTTQWYSTATMSDLLSAESFAVYECWTSTRRV